MMNQGCRLISTSAAIMPSHPSSMMVCLIASTAGLCSMLINPVVLPLRLSGLAVMILLDPSRPCAAYLDLVSIPAVVWLISVSGRVLIDDCPLSTVSADSQRGRGRVCRVHCAAVLDGTVHAHRAGDSRRGLVVRFSGSSIPAGHLYGVSQSSIVVLYIAVVSVGDLVVSEWVGESSLPLSRLLFLVGRANDLSVFPPASRSLPLYFHSAVCLALQNTAFFLSSLRRVRILLILLLFTEEDLLHSHSAHPYVGSVACRFRVCGLFPSVSTAGRPGLSLTSPAQPATI